MRKLAIAAALLFCALPPVMAEGVAGPWATLFREPADSAIGQRYAGNEIVIARYATAMRRYKAAAERSEFDRLAISFLPRDNTGTLEPFTWIADNGDMVRRMGDGIFRLMAGDPLGNWYTETTCQVTLWPTFYCSDDRERVMAAPDLQTMVFDGVTFRRPYPASQ
jgi:hypothetical protein